MKYLRIVKGHKLYEDFFDEVASQDIQSNDDVFKPVVERGPVNLNLSFFFGVVLKYLEPDKVKEIMDTIDHKIRVQMKQLGHSNIDTFYLFRQQKKELVPAKDILLTLDSGSTLRITKYSYPGESATNGIYVNMLLNLDFDNLKSYVKFFRNIANITFCAVKSTFNKDTVYFNMGASQVKPDFKYTKYLVKDDFQMRHFIILRKIPMDKFEKSDYQFLRFIANCIIDNVEHREQILKEIKDRVDKL